MVISSKIPAELPFPLVTAGTITPPPTSVIVMRPTLSALGTRGGSRQEQKTCY